MKVLLSLVCVLGLAVVFGLSEPAPASTQPVTSDDVQLVSEQTLAENGPAAGKNGNRNGGSGRFRLRGARQGCRR